MQPPKGRGGGQLLRPSPAFPRKLKGVRIFSCRRQPRSASLFYLPNVQKKKGARATLVAVVKNKIIHPQTVSGQCGSHAAEPRCPCAAWHVRDRPVPPSLVCSWRTSGIDPSSLPRQPRARPHVLLNPESLTSSCSHPACVPPRWWVPGDTCVAG